MRVGDPDHIAHGRFRWAARQVAVLVFAACLAMWIAIPSAWLLLLSRVGGSTATYVLVLLGLPGTLALWGLLIARLDHLYGHLASRPGTPKSHPPPSVMTASLVITLLLAVAIAGAWLALGGIDTAGHSFGPFPD